ncbi:MAG: hypothetical protein Q4B86_07345 [Eubacteriales bacterium]|nr:hypothetical protein [Eubacteriales bacterium]
MSSKKINKIVQPGYQGYCIFCGTPSTHGVHHFVYGEYGAIRDKADEDGIFADICDSCHLMGKDSLHESSIAVKLSKMFGEAIWQRNYLADNGGTVEDARNEFFKRYGRNYF